MARDHARIKTSIWDDEDFIGLTVAAQHAYFWLESNLGLSRCGVITYVPARFIHLARDLTEAKIRRAVDELRATRFAIVDDRTQELLVRSHVRHDGVLERVNMGKAVGTAFEAVVSARLKDAIGHEMRRFMDERPDLMGWKGLAETSPIAHAMASGMESRMQ